MGAGRDTVKDMLRTLRDRQTISCDHLRRINEFMKGYKGERQGRGTFTSGSLFITFFILAKGNGGCL